MSQSSSNQVNSMAETRGSSWKSIYKIGGAAALLALIVALADIILTFLPTGADVPGTLSAIDWFGLFQEKWFFGLRNLGLLPNIPTQFLLIPVFLALYTAHRRMDKVHAYAALAMVFAFVGTAIYLSNNAALPMLALSGKYAAAATEAEKTLLAAAGEAVLARGEDFAPGAFLGFLFGAVANIAISFVMLRGGVFGKIAAWAGIIGFFLMLVFTICATFIPATFNGAMILALLGGLSIVLWYVLIARRLFQLGRQEKGNES